MSEVSIESAYAIDTPWGVAQLEQATLEDLATFTGKSTNECLRVLQHYEYGQMATAWKAAQPKTAAEMRDFYGATSAYLWSLTLWHASPAYFHTGLVRRMIAQQCGRTGLRALDYGSGIGTTAIQLAEAGYALTVADVPGVSFDYTRHRLIRRGLPYTAVPITTDIPPLEGRYDAIVCFDVLEHVQHPERVFRHLERHLTPDGLIGVVAPFDAQDAQEGYHLRENYLRWGENRWGKFMSGRGFRFDNFLYQRDRLPKRLVRALRYQLWARTGIEVNYLPRTIRGA